MLMGSTALIYYYRSSTRLSLTAHDSLLKSSTNRADHDIDHLLYKPCDMHQFVRPRKLESKISCGLSPLLFDLR